jgi:hypothetical protein
LTFSTRILLVGSTIQTLNTPQPAIVAKALSQYLRPASTLTSNFESGSGPTNCVRLANR